MIILKVFIVTVLTILYFLVLGWCVKSLVDSDVYNQVPLVILQIVLFSVIAGGYFQFGVFDLNSSILWYPPLGLMVFFVASALFKRLLKYLEDREIERHTTRVKQHEDME